MKKHLLTSLLGVLITVSLHAQTGTLITDSIMHDVYRTFMVYVPASYTPDTKASLLLNLHATGIHGVEQNSLADFRSIADTANFIIVLPDGKPVPHMGGFWGWDIFPTTSGFDDVGFLSDLIDTISKRYNIDTDRIYSTGHSAGAIMSYKLACVLSPKICAIAPVNGFMFPYLINSYRPEHPTPVMEIHGTADPVRSWEGIGPVTPAVNIDTMINYWVKFNACSSVPVYDSVSDINKSDNCWVKHYTYRNGTSGSTVEFYKIVNGGHTWPGSAVYQPYGNVNLDFNACKEIWRFLSAQSLTLLTGIRDETREKPGLKVYPNPVSDILNISISNTDSPGKITAYDLLGNEIPLTVKSMASNNISIKTSSWRPGVYLVKINIGDKVYYSKIVKSN